MSHLLIYNDSPTFGGHEVMTLTLLGELLEAGSWTNITVLCYPGNERFWHACQDLATRYPALCRQSWNRPYHRGEAQRTAWAPGLIARLRQRVADINPDVVLAVQGCLEISSLILRAATGRWPLASYIPLPQTWQEMGATGSWLRDCFARPLLAAPDCWITISPNLADRLRQRGCQQPVHVVANPGPTQQPRPSRQQRRRARIALGLPTSGTLVGCIGRLECRQKNQHIFLHAVAEHPDLTAVIAGDGPGRAALQSLSERLGITDRTHFLPWQEDPRSLYQAVDAVVIPSRYEGVPLVMLEALAQGTVVLGSDRDGMADVLPPSWRFAANDRHALAECLGWFKEQSAKDLMASLPTLTTPPGLATAFQPILTQLAEKVRRQQRFTWPRRLRPAS